MRRGNCDGGPLDGEFLEYDMWEYKLVEYPKNDTEYIKVGATITTTPGSAGIGPASSNNFYG